MGAKWTESNLQVNSKKTWEGYKNFDHAWSFGELEEFFHELTIDKFEMSGTYLNVPASFDIETTSSKLDDVVLVKNPKTGKIKRTKAVVKHANMYIWQFGINGSVIYGRSWEEFKTFLARLMGELGLNPRTKKLIVYVHNLSYEFQFIRKQVNWIKDNGKDRVFSVKERRPVYALAECGVEFRCSYLLSNYSLAYVGSELLKKYPVSKLTGDLDYSKPRHSLTPLTKQELEYCLNDVRVVMSYIQEKIEQDGGISKIPLTNTGYVRNYCRNYCYTDAKSEYESKKRKFEYRAMMKNLTIKSEREYNDLKEAFAGGFTHASVLHVGKVMKNVGSADLTSSYPFAMVGQKFPMSEGVFIGEPKNEEQFRMLLDTCCCLFSVRFKNIYSVLSYESYISVSHCKDLSDDYVANNGRLVSAEYAQVTITELDWDIIEKVYDWDEVEIFGMRVYAKDFLPRPIIMSILELYKNKTSLKGVTDKEIEYLVSKNMINAVYGMTVTSIVRNENIYSDQQWESIEADTASQLEIYNKSFNRFLFYAWGVWVTAHARHNLWDAILEFGEDYVYSDTDSIKGIHFDAHQNFFADYNRNVRFQLAEMCNYHKIPFSMCSPKTINGETKLIGLWDIEEGYAKFKTLGAKRYIYEHYSGELNMTVSGVNKKYAMPYMFMQFSPDQYHTEEWEKIFKLAYSPDIRLKEQSHEAMLKIIEEHEKGKLTYDDIFFFFREFLTIPAGYTGKQTLTYIDNPDTFCLVDYMGLPYICKELSSTHMEPTSYYFSITKQYLNYIAGFRDASI